MEDSVRGSRTVTVGVDMGYLCLVERVNAQDREIARVEEEGGSRAEGLAEPENVGSDLLVGELPLIPWDLERRHGVLTDTRDGSSGKDHFAHLRVVGERVQDVDGSGRVLTSELKVEGQYLSLYPGKSSEERLTESE